MKHLAGFVFGILLGVVLASGARDLTATSKYETARSLGADGAVGCARADLNGDGVVNSADLTILLAAWGGSGVGDLNNDGIINGADLTILLAAWS